MQATGNQRDVILRLRQHGCHASHLTVVYFTFSVFNSSQCQSPTVYKLLYQYYRPRSWGSTAWLSGERSRIELDLTACKFGCELRTRRTAHSADRLPGGRCRRTAVPEPTAVTHQLRGERTATFIASIIILISKHHRKPKVKLFDDRRFRYKSS